MYEKFKNVKIDLFYSQRRSSSQKLRSNVPLLIESIGKENFDYHVFDFSTKERKEMVDAYGVRGTPTVVINAQKETESQMRGSYARD